MASNNNYSSRYGKDTFSTKTGDFVTVFLLPAALAFLIGVLAVRIPDLLAHLGIISNAVSIQVPALWAGKKLLDVLLGNPLEGAGRRKQ